MLCDCGEGSDVDGARRLQRAITAGIKHVDTIKGRYVPVTHRLILTELRVYNA
jgi:hypothetical protein